METGRRIPRRIDCATYSRGFVPQTTTGTEHIRPEDTHDHDYGVLLERAYGKGMASHSVPSWNQILSFLQQMAVLRESAGSAA